MAPARAPFSSSMKWFGASVTALVLGCTPPAASVVSDASDDARLEAAADASASDDGAPDVDAGEILMPCQDGGVSGWYLLTTSSMPNVQSATLQWEGPDGLYQGGQLAVHARGEDDPEGLLGDLGWLGELPRFAPMLRVDEVKLLRESENGDRVYRLAIFGHDYGGMSCHESDDRTLLGSAVVDSHGYLVSAQLRGHQTVTTDDDPGCLYMRGTKPISIDVARSCAPPAAAR